MWGTVTDGEKQNWHFTMMRTFLKAYGKHMELFPRRRRPGARPPATYIMDELEANLRLNIRQQTLVFTLDDADSGAIWERTIIQNYNRRVQFVENEHRKPPITPV
jgi:hypothetical protein